MTNPRQNIKLNPDFSRRPFHVCPCWLEQKTQHSDLEHSDLVLQNRLLEPAKTPPEQQEGHQSICTQLERLLRVGIPEFHGIVQRLG
jgi:hypothetical protein